MKEAGEIKMNINVLNENKDTKEIFLDEIPYSYRENIDTLASGLLTNKSGKVMVIGFDSVGKSFLIQQFINNIDSYIQHTDSLSRMLFIKLTQLDFNKLANVNGGVEGVINYIVNQFHIREEELCVVTESPDLASIIGFSLPNVKIILEASIPTFLELKKAEEQGKSKFWGSWDYIDANFIKLNKSDLVEMMCLSLLPASSKIKFRRREISLFITHMLNNMNGVSENGQSIIPPGLWSIALNKAIGTLMFSTDPKLRDNKGNIVYGRVIKKTFDDVADLFSDYMEKLNSSTAGKNNSLLDQIKFLGFFDDSQVSIDELFKINENKEVSRGGVNTESIKGEEDDTIKFKDLSTLESRLNETVIGQSDAINSLINGLSIPIAGINDKNKPLRTILFAGKSGVGKTSLALTLAKELAEEELNVIRLDMSEYSKDHEVAKLFGSAPGYVGHENGGVLTNAVRDNPRSIILLDEVEKADPKIWDSFLQVFDAGRMTDSHGDTVDFSETIIIMTSNLGVKELTKKTAGFIGEETTTDINKNNKKIILTAIEEFFKPEFINRLDEIIFFNDLSKDDIRDIIKKEIKSLTDRIKEKNILLEYPSDVVIDKIYELSDTEKYGAREVQRVILNNIVTPIAKKIINNKDDDKVLSIEYNSGAFVIK